MVNLELGDNKCVTQLHRMNVQKSQRLIVFVYLVTRNFPFDYLRKHTVLHDWYCTRAVLIRSLYKHDRYCRTIALMNVLKKLCLVLASVGIVLFLSMLIVTASLGAILKAEKIKSYLASSHAYETIVQSFTTESKAAVGERVASDTQQQAIEDEIFAAAAQKALSPTFIQSNSEKVIDSTFVWLEGKTDKPDFVLDFTEIKANFVKEAAKNLEKHVANLPACKSGQKPPKDVLAATCVPAGYNVEKEVNKLIKEVTSDQEFLKDPVVTADTLQSEQKQGAPEPLFEQLKSAPANYQRLQDAPLWLAITSLMCAVAIVFTSKTRRTGLRNLGILLAVTGIFSLGLTLGGNVVAKAAVDAANTPGANTNARDAAIQKTIASLGDSVSTDWSSIAINYALVIIGLAGACLVLALVLKKRNKTTASKDTTPAEPEAPSDITSEPKPTEEKTESETSETDKPH